MTHVAHRTLRDSPVSTRRLIAALASGAASGEAIHRAVLSVASRLGLAGDILDLGTGNGALLQQLMAARRGGSATAVDLLSRPDALPADVRWIQADLNDPIPLPDGSFDAIVSVEVIEHLENPRALVRECHRLLKAPGLLILTTPNQESLRSLAALVVRGHFVAFLDASYPAHITALVRRDLARIAAEAGFEPPSFLYSDDGGVPRFPALTWQALSFGLLRRRWFSDNLLVVARKDAMPC